MLQHIFRTLLFAAFALWTPHLLATVHDEPSNPNLSPSYIPPPPPPPPPTNLVITGVTATSISLRWSAPNAPFFRIRVIDVTGSVTLPIVQGNGNQVTIAALQPGHLHHMYVSVASDEPGPFSESVFIEGTTGYVIVDKIIGLQNACSPNQSFQGASHTLCVKKSSSSNPAQYDNGSVGRILFGDAELRFAVVYTTNWSSAPELHIGKLSDQNQKFLFQPINSGLAKCYYKSASGELMLMFDAVAIGFFGVNEAKITLNFSSTFWSGGGDYSFCTRCGEPPRGVVDEQANKRDISQTEPLNHPTEPLVRVAPNPITASTLIQYSLDAPSLVSLQLFDATGQFVQAVQPQVHLEAGEYTATLNAESLPNGPYFLVTQKGQHRQVTALLKQQ